MKTTLEHALAYIARGWSVVPLVAGTKRPAIALAPFLSGEERADEQRVRDWFDGDGEQGIAIITGHPSGIVVVDIDPRNGGDATSQPIMELRTGCVAQTGGGGIHLICAYPGVDGSVPCGKTILPGVDRKGDGGYIVAPPSIHPSGVAYEWLEFADLGSLPEWVLQKHTSTQESSDEPTEPWIGQVLGNPRDCAPGGQEETLSRLCWWAARKLPFDIAQGILTTWALQLPLGDPHEPWTAAHVDTKLGRAYEKAAALPPSFNVTMAGVTGNAVSSSSPSPAAADAYEAAAAKHLVPIPALEFPDQQWVVTDFAAPGAFTEVIGKVKKGKSTLVYQLIDAVRKGEPFLGRETIRSGAVVLTEQVGTSLKKTLERAGLLDAADVWIIRKADITALGSWEKAVWVATCACIRNGFKLLVVDTLSRLAGLHGDAENSSGSVAVLNAFEAARAAGVACIFVRHARKGQSGEAEDIADAGRGSSAITGDMDIVIRVMPHQTDFRRVTWESRITDDPDDIFLEYQDGKYLVVDEPESKRERQRDERFEQMQAAITKVGEKTSDLQKELGWSPHTIIRYREQCRKARLGGMTATMEDPNAGK